MKVDYYAITLRVKSFGDGEFATVAQIPNCFFEIAEKLSQTQRSQQSPRVIAIFISLRIMMERHIS